MLSRLRDWQERRRFLAAVLAEVNAIRGEHGMGPLKRLPKGQRDRPSKCPVARCLGRGGMAGDGQWWFDGDAPMRRMSPVLRTFVKRFDSGDFPHLIERNI